MTRKTTRDFVEFLIECDDAEGARLALSLDIISESELLEILEKTTSQAI